jgi:hypothetical protein
LPEVAAGIAVVNYQRTPGGAMGKKPRIGLLLAATSCLLAVLVDWVVEEL